MAMNSLPPEQKHAVDALIGRVSRRAWRGALVLLVAFTTAILALSIHANNTSNLAKSALAISEARHEALRTYQIASCKRGNETRVAENRSHRDDYLFDTQIAQLLSVALAQPSTPNPRLSGAQQGEDTVRVRLLIHNLKSYAADKEWRYPIADCEYAVDHPQTYALPLPVKFSKQMPPPEALYLPRQKSVHAR